MTTRLYYDDSDLMTFDATVVTCAPVDDRFEIVLDRTAFYPTSGGQPFDTGTLDDAQVVDVIDRDEAGIVHVVRAALAPGQRVTGTIDDARRRDHREQHTGQHVLSAAFERTGGVATVGFHMGGEVSTIDLAREVSAAEIDAAEDDANRVIREDREVTVRIVPEDEIAALALRRQPTRRGALRIVEVTGYDVSACGGTHVARTGAIGLVVVTGVEKVRGGSRLTFLCGGRAVRGFRERRDRLAEIGRRLGVAAADVGPRVARLQQDLRDAEAQGRDLRQALALARAVAWRGEAETMGPWRVVIRATDLAGGDLSALARAIVAEPGIVTVLTGRGVPVPVVVARSADVALVAGAVLKAMAAALGGRGGGRPDLAQGGVTAEAPAIAAFVRGHLADVPIA